MRAVAVIFGTFISYSGGLAFAQPNTNILPPGYEMDTFSSGWLGPGNTATRVCPGLVRAEYGNRPFQIMNTSEEHKWEIPELRINARYRYHCTVLLGPKSN